MREKERTMSDWTFADMAERGAKSTPDTWPQARRVEVARHVLTTARVPELVAEVERLWGILHRLTHMVRDPECPLCEPERRP